jgi:hypothetical protein
MEHVMGELNYWTDLMTRWGVGWVDGSGNKAHGKMPSLFAQPYISPPDYDTLVFPSKRKEILLEQKSAVNEYERCQQSNAMARQEVCSAARTNVVFTNIYVDNNSSLISE